MHSNLLAPHEVVVDAAMGAMPLAVAESHGFSSDAAEAIGPAVVSSAEVTLAQRVRSCVLAAQTDGPVAPLAATDGLSGYQLLGLLQRLNRLQQARGGVYLEVGVLRGLTLISTALAQPKGQVYGIDNFSQLNSNGSNEQAVRECAHRHGLGTQVHLINADFEDALMSWEKLGGHPIGTYFIDGPHDYRSQYQCLELARPFLLPGATIVVDDANYRHVRLASADFLRARPEFKLFYEAYTGAHPQHLKGDALQAAQQGWWNGVNVLIHDPDDRLARRYPPTERDRGLFLNDHEVHAARYARHAPAALELLDHLTAGRQQQAQAVFTRTQAQLSAPDVHRGQYATGNTHSEGLPVGRFYDES
jgi:predicted O-methyltransferase YrrM